MKQTFSSLQIEHKWEERLSQQRIVTPTNIQLQSIPVLLEGKDAMIQAITGSGKTLAYLLPFLQQLDQASKLPQLVIIVPTRELAMQVTSVARELIVDTNLGVAPLIGGAAIKRQVELLKKPHQIIVGTPGRIVELIQMKKLKMHLVKTVVIDEADQIVLSSTWGETETIIKSTLRDRQLLFVSATLPQAIQTVAGKWMNDAVFIRESTLEEQIIPESIKHYVFQSAWRDRFDVLRRVLRFFEPKSAMIFVNDPHMISELEEKLTYHKFTVAALHSRLKKEQRATIMQQFRTGKLPLLITTDVGSRGLDLPDVDFVIQYEPPTNSDVYVHRSGRTGRMGRPGTVLSLTTAPQALELEKLTSALQIELQQKELHRGKLVDATTSYTQT